MPGTKFRDLLGCLQRNKVEFIVIGGVAAVLRGSAHFTSDLDICYRRTPENFKRLVDALKPLNPNLRNAPVDLPFIFDEHTLKNGLNFTFDTDFGMLDILGEVGGIGFYDACASVSSKETVFDVECLVLDIDALIKSKKFARRAKDNPVILELEAIRELTKKHK